MDQLDEDKLSSITEKKKKLLEEESKLIEKRKKEIGHLAEKFGLFTMPDTLITGLFLEAQSALKEKSEKIKTWESHGERFINPKRNTKATQENTA
jgi:Conjugal transfer protein TraD